MMLLYDQTISGPDVDGDCLRACLATLLQLPFYQVPHFAEKPWDGWYERFEDWVQQQGYQMQYVKPEELASVPGFVLVFGRAGKGGQHACIYSSGRLFHDPHSTRLGLDTKEWAAVLNPIEHP